MDQRNSECGICRCLECGTRKLSRKAIVQHIERDRKDGHIDDWQMDYLSENDAKKRKSVSKLS